MTRRMLNLLHSISASSKHFSQKELASAVNMSARHIENLDFFFWMRKYKSPAVDGGLLLSLLWRAG